jgi:hypothetical protein
MVRSMHLHGNQLFSKRMLSQWPKGRIFFPCCNLCGWASKCLTEVPFPYGELKPLSRRPVSPNSCARVDNQMASHLCSRTRPVHQNVSTGSRLPRLGTTFIDFSLSGIFLYPLLGRDVLTKQVPGAQPDVGLMERPHSHE